MANQNRFNFFLEEIKQIVPDVGLRWIFGADRFSLMLINNGLNTFKYILVV